MIVGFRGFVIIACVSMRLSTQIYALVAGQHFGPWSSCVSHGHCISTTLSFITTAFRQVCLVLPLRMIMSSITTGSPMIYRTCIVSLFGGCTGLFTVAKWDRCEDSAWVTVFPVTTALYWKCPGHGPKKEVLFRWFAA